MGKYLPAIISCISLVALTLVGFAITLNNYFTNIQGEFEQLADARVIAIQRSLNDKLLIMESMRAMYAAYDGVPQPQFGAFVEPFENVVAGIQALQWIVPVPLAYRAAFEQARRDEGITGFEIVERLPEGTMTRAGDRAIYYPVYPVLPLDVGEASIGYDIISDPLREAALQAAITRNDFTASARVSLLQGGEDAAGILVFAPLFADDPAPGDSPGAPTLLGLVAGIFNIGAIIDESISRLEHEPINVDITDLSADAGMVSLYRYRAGETASGELFAPDPYARNLEFAGRVWQINTSPAAGYMYTRSATVPWTILVLGLLGSLGLTAYQVNMTRHGLKIHHAEQERQNLENQLFRSQKMEAMGQLVGGIAHDFNNILTSVLGYSELAMLRNQDRDDVELAQYLNNINSGANRGKRLIQKMLRFSRRLPAQKSSVDIRPVIENTLDLLSPLITSNVDIRYRADGLTDLPPINIDATSLDQILVNLCINARDAIPDKGVITITLGEKRVPTTGRETCRACGDPIVGHFVSIAVSDNGEGIAPDNLGTVFKPFYTTKEEDKGTGMGLAIINTIIHNHEGHILLTSELGAGTTFELLLPVENTFQQ